MVTGADNLIMPALVQTIGALALEDQDAAAVKLARLYALQIDQATVSGDPKITAWTVRWIGPELLKALESLGATPAARAALAKRGGQPERGESQLDRLRKAKARPGA